MNVFVINIADKPTEHIQNSDCSNYI